MIFEKKTADKNIQIRVTQEEKDLISSKAKEKNKTVTEYVKEAIKEKMIREGDL